MNTLHQTSRSLRLGHPFDRRLSTTCQSLSLRIYRPPVQLPPSHSLTTAARRSLKQPSRGPSWTLSSAPLSTTTPNSSASTPSSATPAPINGQPLPPQPNNRPRNLNILLLLLSAAGLATYALLPAPPPTEMTPTRFAPYTVVEKSPFPAANLVSLTLIPSSPNATIPAPLPPLCSVETAHPAIQIVREYTPFRASFGGRPALQLVVRVYPDGEMGRYLAGLEVGGEVRLRGPCEGFDVGMWVGGGGGEEDLGVRTEGAKGEIGMGEARREESANEVVFLAGGTGIIPAIRTIQSMQAGETIMPGKITILWAIRNMADFSSPAPAPSTNTPPPQQSQSQPQPPRQDQDQQHQQQQLTPLGAALVSLKNTLGDDRLAVHVFLDNPRCGITPADVERAMNLHTTTATTTPTVVQEGTPPERTCFLHNPSATLLLGRNPAESTGLDFSTCHCPSSSFPYSSSPPSLPAQTRTKPGKNVLVVSGPDGFVGYMAGPMAYLDRGGAWKRQGLVRGLVGDVLARNPRARGEWVVLKLDG